MNKPAEVKPLTFRDCVLTAAATPEFVEQFNRLTGCNLGQSLNRTALDKMIDEAAGFSGETEEDMATFVAFVHEMIWVRLIQEPTS